MLLARTLVLNCHIECNYLYMPEIRPGVKCCAWELQHCFRHA